GTGFYCTSQRRRLGFRLASVITTPSPLRQAYRRDGSADLHVARPATGLPLDDSYRTQTRPGCVDRLPIAAPANAYRNGIGTSKFRCAVEVVLSVPGCH